MYRRSCDTDNVDLCKYRINLVISNKRIKFKDRHGRLGHELGHSL